MIPNIEMLPPVPPELARLNYIAYQMRQGIDVRTPEEKAADDDEMRKRLGDDADSN